MIATGYGVQGSMEVPAEGREGGVMCARFVYCSGCMLVGTKYTSDTLLMQSIADIR